MKRSIFLAALFGALALALAGCDYGYADGEDPALEGDDGTGTLELGLRADDPATDSERLGSSVLDPSGAPTTVTFGYVAGTGSGTAPVPSLPVQHPDPKPWKN